MIIRGLYTCIKDINFVKLFYTPITFDVPKFVGFINSTVFGPAGSPEPNVGGTIYGMTVLRSNTISYKTWGGPADPRFSTSVPMLMV